MSLESFLSELPKVVADATKPAWSPVADRFAPAPTAKPKGETQHLVMSVPNPKTEIRLGKAPENVDEKTAKAMNGFVTSTVSHAWLVAGQNVVTVAGEADPKKAYKFAKEEASGQSITQTAISVGLDLMKMIVAPTSVGVGMALGSVAGGIAKVAIEKTDAGHLSISAKQTVSLIAGQHAQLSGLVTTTVWGGVTKCGATTSMSIQGGLVASLSSSMTSCVVSARLTELVSGWETEVASRWGETIVRGKEIKIGFKGAELLQKLQRPTEEVLINAMKEVRITTNAAGSDGLPPHSLKEQDALIFMEEDEIKIDAKEVHVGAEESAKIHVGSSILAMEEEEVHLGVSGTLEASQKAMDKATEAYIKATKQIAAIKAATMAAATSPLIPSATASTARAAARIAYEAQLEAATAALEAALKASETSSPTLHMTGDSAHLTTSVTNGVKISRNSGIKLVSGACEITMTPAGIVLKFGNSKIVLGPVGIVIDAGPGVIVQKATTVNSP